MEKKRDGEKERGGEKITEKNGGRKRDKGGERCGKRKRKAKRKAEKERVRLVIKERCQQQSGKANS